MADWFAQSIADAMQVVTPTTGATIAMNAGATALIINTTGLVAALSVVLPPAPVDGQRALIAAGSAITLITISGDSGTPVKGALTTMALNSYARFLYSAQVGAWFRTG